MKLLEAISAANAARPNSIPPQLKYKWLSEVEAKIYNELYFPYEPDCGEFRDPAGLDDNEDLLLPLPYSELYPAYLRMKIDLFNAEYDRYSFDKTYFEEMYDKAIKFRSRSCVAKSSQRLTS